MKENLLNISKKYNNLKGSNHVVKYIEKIAIFCEVIVFLDISK